MTTINARGAYCALEATPNTDIVRAYQITDAGVAHDLSNSSLSVKVMDAESSNSVLATYTQTVSDAAQGSFELKIPKTLFQSRAGEELFYELILTEGGNDKALLHGPIIISEAY